MNKENNCPKSYSNEHSGTPINENFWQCVHCGKILNIYTPV